MAEKFHLYQDNENNENLSECITDLLNIVRKHRVSFNGDVFNVIMTTVVLEGWASKLDPNINLMNMIKKVRARRRRRAPPLGAAGPPHRPRSPARGLTAPRAGPPTRRRRSRSCRRWTPSRRRSRRGGRGSSDAAPPSRRCRGRETARSRVLLC